MQKLPEEVCSVVSHLHFIFWNFLANMARSGMSPFRPCHFGFLARNNNGICLTTAGSNDEEREMSDMHLTVLF